MTDDQQLLRDFHAMDDVRQQQIRMAIKALAAEFPRRAALPRLTLVGSIIRDSAREGLQNYQ
jgi:hypothetical protein